MNYMQRILNSLGMNLDKIKSRLFFRTLREFKRRGNIFSRGARCNIITTTRCPYHCEYCPMFLYGRQKIYPESSFEEWRVFLDRFPMWISTMYISGGEPSLYKDLVLLVNYLIKRGHHVHVQTNLYRPEAFIGIHPHWRLLFLASHHKEAVDFYDKAEYLRSKGFNVITQAVGEFDKRNNRVKEFFTEKWFKEVDNAIMFEPSTPRTLRMWIGCVNMFRNDTDSLNNL